MTEPRRIGAVWIDGRGAVVGRWEEEPVFERIESGVPARRRAAGSVRRGPARPFGGGSVGGSGNEQQHALEMRRFLATVADAVAELDEVEVSGRGPVHERLAHLLQQLSERGDGEQHVTTRALGRRPTPRQMAARLRNLAGEPPRRRARGPYRPEKLQEEGGARAPASRRDMSATRRPRHLPEREDIEQQLEAWLGDDAGWW